MHFQRESKTPQTISSYSDTHVTINSMNYQDSMIVSQNSILSWSVHAVSEITEFTLAPLIELTPEIVLIGIPLYTVQYTAMLSQLTASYSMSIEIMPLGGACRTFNILLNEGRHPVLGIIF